MAISLRDTKNKISFLTPEQKKQKKMLGFLVIIVLIILAIIYFGYFKKENISNPAIDSLNNGVKQDTIVLMEKAIKELKQENFIYQEKNFIDLKTHGDLPIVVGDKGRENPFAPF